MNTEELKVNLKKDYGIHYSKAEVLEALDVFFKDHPYLLFDLICEAGQNPMIADMKEYVACYMMEEQKKEQESHRSFGEAVSTYDECDDLLLGRYY
jgi:hypothetical protein